MHAQHALLSPHQNRAVIRQRCSNARNVPFAKAAAAAASPAASKQGNPFLNVVLPTAVTLMLCNMDRICLSVAIMPMAKEFAWPASMQGVVQSAFLWGYMATQFIGGSLADK